MVKRLLTILLLVISVMSVSAQRKQINQALDYLKSGKDYDKAEKLMDDLLKDSTNRKKEKIWQILIAAQKGQYEQGNEKLYLNEKYDTAQFFLMARKLFQTMERFDSLEMQPNEKGRVKIKYRDKNAHYLDKIRINLYNAGVYFAKKNDFATAYDYFDAYLDCARQPLFTDYQYAEEDVMMPIAACWTVFCGRSLGDAELTLKYHQLAEKDDARLVYVLQYEAETYASMGNREDYLKTLKRGFELYPTYDYFFRKLMRNYWHQKDNDTAMQMVSTALAVDSTNRVFRFAENRTLLNLGRYDECIETGKKLLAQNDSIAEVYFTVGLAYYNQAVNKELAMNGKNAKERKTARMEMKKLYEQSLPYLEKYRKMAPEQQNKWLTPLYNIYLNLNMGKEFDEIIKIRHERENTKETGH